jgi:UDP-glucuronate decarboxylase
MSRFLVAGGAGFIGSALCKKLLELGHEVLAVDNLVTGRKANINHLTKNKNFEFMRHDVTFPLYVEVDGIFNLACPASPVHYQNDPVQTMKTSVIGSINLLGLAKRLEVKILQASTSEVYGDPEVSPQAEEYWGRVNPIGIRACYDEGKRAAETLFFDYYRQYGIDIRVVRIFNTYGPGMALNDGRVVSNFSVQALKNQDITIFGDGSQNRSFCFVDDLVSGIVGCFESISEKIHQPINLGNPENYTMLEIANKIRQATKSSSEIVFKELPQDDPKQRNPDISKAKEILNWNPTINFDNGIQQTIDYFRQEIKNQND